MTQEQRGLSDEDVDDLRELLKAMRDDRWAGAPVLRDTLPVMPKVLALPTASVEYAYALVALVGTPDISYQCLRSAGGAWGWRIMATG